MRATRAIIAVMLGLVAGMSAIAAASSVRIVPGRWMLHPIGSREPAHAICVSDAAALLQLRHPGLACARFPVRDDARSTTVYYTCPRAGHGQTTLTVEDDGLVRLQTQGIAGGQPFDEDLEARRVGSCG